MTLGGNQYKEENHRLQWRAENDENSTVEVKNLRSDGDNFIVSLEAMEIRTFLLKLADMS